MANTSLSTHIKDDKNYVVFVNRGHLLIAKYAYTALFFFGTPANLFAFVSILYRRLYKSPMFVFFAFMAAMDTIRVATEGGANFVRAWIFTTPRSADDANTIHCWSFVIGRYLGDTAMTASAWVMVVANAYKLYALVKPFRINHSDKQFALRSCIIISTIFFGINVVKLVGYTIVETDMDNKTVYVHISFRRQYAFFFINYFFPYGLVIYSVIPGILFIIFSIAIPITFWGHYKKHLLMTRRETVDKSAYKTAKASIMALLPLSFVHVACTLPGLITMINYDAATVGTHSVILWSLNHSINVYVQMACSKYYRNSILGRKE